MRSASRYAALLRHPSPRVLSRALARRGRSIAYGFGNTVTCPYCGWTGFRFLPAGAKSTSNRKCPGCGSLQRHRLLYDYLEASKLLDQQTVRLLDVAPKPCFAQFCARLPNVRYISTDLQSAGADVLTDLTQAGFRACAFDVVVCFHVLEHIPDDRAALREIRRILTPGGTALLQVPLTGDITADGPEFDAIERTRRFGQEDHVRAYGRDILERCRAAGLAAEIHETLDELAADVVRRHALEGDDRVIIVAQRGLGEVDDGDA